MKAISSINTIDTEVSVTPIEGTKEPKNGLRSPVSLNPNACWKSLGAAEIVTLEYQPIVHLLRQEHEKVVNTFFKPGLDSYLRSGSFGTAKYL